ncbi:MAG: TolC family protein [Cytophagales bacterium]|nr:TolC family protein [Cytophagales bacterium]
MYKKIAFALCGCLWSAGLMAQPDDIAGVLREVEQNNPELKALSAQMESRQLELKSGNNLQDPQLGAYYLPFGEHVTGDYSEFQISQSFEFPTVYSARNRLTDARRVQLNLDYAAKRQEVLLAAQKICQELVYLHKRIALEQNRVEQAETVYEQVRELYDKEQVGAPEMNKAKVSWMQEQFKVRVLEGEKQNLLLLLRNLNGDNPLSFDQTDYFAGLEIEDKDSIWQGRLISDPVLREVVHRPVIAERQLRLIRNKSLPGFTAGYNYQGVAGANYSGIYAGLNIPLWSNRHRVKASRSNLRFQESYSDVQIGTAYVAFETQYNEYRVLLEKFREYESTLNGLNSDRLLLEAYRLGEISFIEYYMELRFYRQAYDAMLEMEQQLHQLRAEIHKHQL